MREKKRNPAAELTTAERLPCSEGRGVSGETPPSKGRWADGSRREREREGLFNALQSYFTLKPFRGARLEVSGAPVEGRGGVLSGEETWTGRC